MPKRKDTASRRSPRPHPVELSGLAATLLRAMASAPDRLEYNTRVLGGMFRAEALEDLDAAYGELRKAGLIESAGAVVMFFGVPKALFRISAEGLAYVSGSHAA